MTILATRLRQLREQSGLTQQQVADGVGLGKQAISQYELDKRSPDYETLERLCDFFNVSSDYLLGNSDYTIRILGTQELNILAKAATQTIPVMGRVNAGLSGEAIEYTEDFVAIPGSWEGDYGALKVHGDSMLPLMRDGDTVIFRRQNDCDSEDIVIAIIDGTETTIKKLVKSRHSITLQPFNPAYEPLVFTNAQAKERLSILGKVVENRQKF